MRYSENLHLNLPEDSDPLEIDKISENFEVLDGAIKEQSKASGYQVGDTLTTWRTDLGEEWLLCNGDILRAEDYPDLRACLKSGGMPDRRRFFCWARRFDAGILCVFPVKSTRPSGKRCAGMAF